MGFIKEVYSNNRAGLVVAFGRGSTSANYFDGDSVEEAMNHFNIYLKENNLYVKTEDETAIEALAIKAEDAVEFRSTVDAIINTLTDEQAIGAPVLFPVWQKDVKYKIGDRVRYEGRLYKVIQEHNSQIDWTPATSPSLFASLLIDEENGNILEWVQPDSTNPYCLNSKVIHNGKFWISTADGNIWEPDTIGAPWIEYIANWENGTAYSLNQKVLFRETTYISLVERNISVPTDTSSWEIYTESLNDELITEPSTEEKEDEDVIVEWVQPDSSFAYSIGDKVSYNGIIYESLIDNNVWSPADYPAGWNEVI